MKYKCLVCEELKDELSLDKLACDECEAFVASLKDKITK